MAGYFSWSCAAVLIVMLLMIFQGAFSQLPPTQSCPTLQQATLHPNTSCSFTNCTSLTCTLPVQLEIPGTITFQVEKCLDPVAVVVNVTTVDSETFTQRFTRDGQFPLIGERGLLVVMSRNGTFLNLTVTTYSSVPVVPRLLVPLTPPNCTCESLTDLAANTMGSIYIPSCATNEACDGVRCRVNAVGDTYYLEGVILPCENAVELLVENEFFQRIYATRFNETGVRTIVVDGTPIVVNSTIEPRQYSMDLAFTLTVPIFGNIELLEPHNVILDRTDCPTHNFTTVAPPPPPTPLPHPGDDASPTCLGFYEAVTRDDFVSPLQCQYLDSNCENGLLCDLPILNVKYKISIRYLTASSGLLFQVVDPRQSGMVVGSGSGSAVNVTLPLPDDAVLAFAQRNVAATLQTFQIKLYIESMVNMIVPSSLIPLAMEQCQSLIQASLDPSTRCAANGDCTGMTCDLDQASATENNAVFVVSKCVDPVVVTITVFHGAPINTSLVHSKRIFLGGSEFLSVNLARYATDLNFTAYISDTSNTRLRPVFPPTLIPLNASDCMCSSMEELAEISGHTAIESNCLVLSDCESMRCQLNVLNLVYYLELAIIPCNETFYLVIEDANFDTVHSSYFSSSRMEVIEIVPGFPLRTNVTLVKRDYSIEIEATITEPLFGSFTIVPRHVIILDKTQCNYRNFSVVVPPPPAVLPMPPPASSSKTCMAFYDIIKSHFMEPLLCTFQTSCDDGIRCRLDLLSSSYNITLSVSEPRTGLSMVVTDVRGQVVGGGSAAAVNVSLPVPAGSNLTLRQDYDGAGTVGLQLDLYVFALSGESRRDVLIDYTKITLEEKSEPESSSNSTVVVAIVVPLLLLAALTLTAVLIVLIVVFFRRRSVTKDFTFQPMSHRELEEKDLENFLATQQGSLPSTKAGVIAGSEDGEKGKDGSNTGDGNYDHEEMKFDDVDLKNGHLV